MQLKNSVCMIFQPTISNEQTAELPSAQFNGRIIVIDSDEQVDAVCRDLEGQKIIGFDTETRPSFKAGVTNKVALLQLSTRSRCYLIRLCKMKLHNALLKILSSPDIIKIGADVAGDIRSLHALRHFSERGFLDLQHIASKWGIEEKSLRKMSAIVLGQRVSKAQRLSNWEATALTPQQQMYAATDAWVCIKILERLQSTPLTTGERVEEVLQQAIVQATQEKPAESNKAKRRRNHHNRKKRVSENKTHKNDNNTDISTPR